MFGCLSLGFAVEGITVGVPEDDNGERRLWIQWTSTAVSEASFEGLAPSLVPAADKCPAGTDKFTITAFYRQVAGGTAEGGQKAGAFWGCRSTALEIQGIAPIT